jgi:hypothetical protein
LVDSDAPRERSADIRLPEPPFRRPEDALEQVARAVRAHTAKFGAPPRGAWPPEGAVSQAALAALVAAGFRWVASDETVLRAALPSGAGESTSWPRALYQAHRVETDAGPVSMLFRDRALSDRIGFTYARWDPRAAAEDFVGRVHAARAECPEGESPIVTVILDGENCWESYEEDGNPFLEELYRRIDADPEIEAVTVTEALERVPPVSRLRRVPVGSWIRDDLAIWIGHPEKNRAWEELRRARDEVARVAAAGNAGAPGALEELYAAEASDWFWWYGDDHPTIHADVFDRLYRARLRNAYRRLGAATPVSLLQSLRGSGSGGDAGVGGDAGGALQARPTIDGRETDFYEWRGAALYEAAGGSGSMHQASAVLRAIRYGLDGADLFVRVDWDRGREAEGCVLAIELEDAPERSVRVPLRSKSAGPARPPNEREFKGDSGEYSVDEIVEIRLPLDPGGGGLQSVVRFRVALEREGRPEEVAPHSGWFELRLPPESRGTQWSAL